MSEQFETSPMADRFASFRSLLNRWGFSWTFSAAKPVPAVTRRPGAASLAVPIYTEVSPAMVEPFPEPRTIPGGWDLSELNKSR